MIWIYEAVKGRPAGAGHEGRSIYSPSAGTCFAPIIDIKMINDNGEPAKNSLFGTYSLNALLLLLLLLLHGHEMRRRSSNAGITRTGGHSCQRNGTRKMLNPLMWAKLI